MEYTLFILILPLLSFCGARTYGYQMETSCGRHNRTLVLGTVAALSYYTAGNTLAQPILTVHIRKSQHWK